MDYILIPNNLKTSKDPYMVRVVDRMKMSEQQFYDYIEGMSPYSASLVRAIHETSLEALGRILTSHCTDVNTAFGEFSAALRGTFSEYKEPFNAKLKRTNHRITVNASASKNLISHVQLRLEARRVYKSPVRMPCIQDFLNLMNGSTDSCSSGDMIELKGNYLSFDRSADDEGVFFEPAEGSLIRSPFTSQVTHSRVVAKVPDLSPGDYIIQIRKRADSSQKIYGSLWDAVHVADTKLSSDSTTVKSNTAAVENNISDSDAEPSVTVAAVKSR